LNKVTLLFIYRNIYGRYIIYVVTTTLKDT